MRQYLIVGWILGCFLLRRMWLGAAAAGAACLEETLGLHHCQLASAGHQRDLAQLHSLQVALLLGILWRMQVTRKVKRGRVRRHLKVRASCGLPSFLVLRDVCLQ